MARTARAKRERVSQVRMGSYALAKKGVSTYDFTDPYHLAVALTWPRFLAAMLGLYLSVNLLFACLYVAAPRAIANAHPGSFADGFFFSLETLATVGYGEMYPATLYGHIVAATEIICGVAFTAILTGLTFVRFSRPRARFIYADSPVVAVHNGAPTLMLRIGNGRPGILSDANARLNALLPERTAEGHMFRAARELRLTRRNIPIFPLTWTLMHRIDETSPLHGYDMARLVADGARFFLSVTARDPTLAAEVHDIRDYGPETLRFGMRYADAIFTNEDGQATADLTRISLLEPDLGPERPEGGWSAEQTEEVD